MDLVLGVIEAAVNFERVASFWIGAIDEAVFQNGAAGARAIGRFGYYGAPLLEQVWNTV